MSGIVVFAYADVGHACLSRLFERGAPVSVVYTYRDRPDETIWFPSVAALAAAHGVEVRTDRDLTTPGEQTALIELAPDLLLSLYYRDLLPAAVLAVPRLGAFNMHGSLLPAYRGRAPVNWAVLNGERETGATLHVMVPRADAGDIVDQQAVPIGPDDSAAIVQARVRDAAVAILDRRLDELLTGRAPRRPQPPGGRTFGRRTPADGKIDWLRPARRVHDLVRAVTHPYPGAFADLFGETIHVWQTRVAPAGIGATGAAAPGTAQLVEGRLYVTCGDGATVEIVRGQRPGAAEVDGATLAAELSVAQERGMTR